MPYGRIFDVHCLNLWNCKISSKVVAMSMQGKLADGSEVAVKQLLTKAQQNMDDFLNEVVLLTSVKHRNLVKLKGCCLRGDRRLLVYEYLGNHDLADTLFGKFTITIYFRIPCM